jgi:hypothetical protein
MRCSCNAARLTAQQQRKRTLVGHRKRVVAGSLFAGRGTFRLIVHDFDIGLTDRTCRSGRQTSFQQR